MDARPRGLGARRLCISGSPAAWSEDLQWVTELGSRPATDAEQHKLRKLDDAMIATFTITDGGDSFEVATAGANRLALVGPLAMASDIA